MLKFRSSKSIVIAPARTGRESKRRIAVNRTDQVNKGNCSIFREGFRIFKMVEIKLIAPRMEEIPAKWREKMARSTAGPLCAK